MLKGFSFVLVFVLSGCTHLTVSDPELIGRTYEKSPNSDLTEFPINIDADMSCYSSTAGAAMGGALVKTSCSNSGYIFTIAESFKERGYKLVKVQDKSSPEISFRVDELNGFLEGITGFFNVFTLGLSPLYHHDTYTVTYKSPKENIDITKSVRVYSTTSWFSLLRSKPDYIDNGSIKLKVQEQLVRAVLSDAKI